MAKNTYIDLFAGCGGLSLGLHQAGWKGLFAVEKSPLAFETLEHNLIKKKSHFEWPEWLPCQSHNIDEVIDNYKQELVALRGTVDMVVGGPPCQGFSTAGRRKEDDERNNLIRSYLKFIMYVQPKIIFFENVKGFTLKFKKNKKRGIAYSGYVTAMLEKLGYTVKGELVDFSKYGVPQKRTRFILVGIRNNELPETKSVEFFEQLVNSSNHFLESRGLSKVTKVKDAISDLLKEHGTVECLDRNNFQSGIYSSEMTSYQKYLREGSKDDYVDSHSFPRHRASTTERFQYYLKTAQKNKTVSKEIKELLKVNKHTIIPLDANSQSPTLTTLPDDYIHYSEPRILTVREYARIQSFPDWYQFRGKYTTGGKERVKEVPRYTQIGNAIPPLFAEQAGLILQTLTQSYA
ncbi:MAG: DNA (cytosine-5-)-methyltransferase [Flammeovirgaceae bacterium]|nr:DNA (cytosine-5-)-methyltransferase [Flammeovirgaceae bacterium]MBR10937.1 DNA (cytosine-5-)-methyltransferase [Rickettsiales bacterium]HCX20471.1 DNA (cytosine-5-)-methyltransferase [Cytophagales bacterium]